MGLSLADEYYLKAVDNYDYNLAEVVEPLNYALSYDEEHVPSLCLMARIKMDYLKDYKSSRHYFEMALIADPYFIDTYKYYSKLLIWIGELEKAEQLINRSVKVKGLSNGFRHRIKANIYEYKGRPDLAISEIKKAKLFSVNAHLYDFCEKEEIRLKKKIAKKKRKKSKKN